MNSSLCARFDLIDNGEPVGWLLLPGDQDVIGRMHERYVGVAVDWRSPPVLPSRLPNIRAHPQDVRTFRSSSSC